MDVQEYQGETRRRSGPGPIIIILAIVVPIVLCVALAVAGFLFFVVSVRVVPGPQLARQTGAKSDISNLSIAVEAFKIENARYPDSIEDLITPPADALGWDGPYLEGANVPRDPWGNEYVYVLEGGEYTIISYGADGIEGGEGENEDISSRE